MGPGARLARAGLHERDEQLQPGPRWPWNLAAKREHQSAVRRLEHLQLGRSGPGRAGAGTLQPRLESAAKPMDALCELRQCAVAVQRSRRRDAVQLESGQLAELAARRRTRWQPDRKPVRKRGLMWDFSATASTIRAPLRRSTSPRGSWAAATSGRRQCE